MQQASAEAVEHRHELVLLDPLDLLGVGPAVLDGPLAQQSDADVVVGHRIDLGLLEVEFARRDVPVDRRHELRLGPLGRDLLGT
ncbi:MAG: hypothetical protein KDC98_19835, partial [Planctomycetes bacterium]|nr:hypothetical protein [Planctomycetota bacterium]